MTSSVYNYVNNAKVWLPMMAATHDPVNVRTLDVSGNNNHFRFADGVTSSAFPTKQSQRGYFFNNAASQYMYSLNNLTNALTSGTWALFFTTINISFTRDLYFHSNGADVRAVLYQNGNLIRFFCGDIANDANIAITTSSPHFVVGRRTADGYRRIYMDGINGTPNNAGVSVPSITVPTNPVIGARATAGPNYHNGNILWHGYWEYALSDLQIIDLEARLRRRINDA